MPIDFTPLKTDLQKIQKCRKACNDIPFLPKTGGRYKERWKKEKNAALGKTSKLKINMGAVLARFEQHEAPFFAAAREVVRLRIDLADPRQQATAAGQLKQLSAHAGGVAALLSSVQSLFEASKKSERRIDRKSASPEQLEFLEHLQTMTAETKKLARFLAVYESKLSKLIEQLSTEYSALRSQVIEQNLIDMGMMGGESEDEEDVAPKFVPRAYTSKEWKKNRIRACNGSGMGKGLDGWQRYALAKPLRDMSEKELSVAQNATKTLSKAIETAKGKCKKPSQRNMLLALEGYARTVQRFNDAGRAATAALDAREKEREALRGMSLQEILNHRELGKVFDAYSRGPSDFFPILDTYRACLGGRAEDAVKRYSEGNEYNISGGHNKGLRVLFGLEPASSPEKAQKAQDQARRLTDKLKGQTYGMLFSQLNPFRSSEPFAAAVERLVAEQYPIPDFRL